MARKKLTRSVASSSCPSPITLRLVSNLHDEVGFPSARHLDGDFIVDCLTQERAPERRVHADVTLRGIEFVRTDDAVLDERAVFVFELDPGAEENARRIGRRLVDDDHAVESLSQEAHPSIDLAELAFAVDVFGVLRAVPL